MLASVWPVPSSAAEKAALLIVVMASSFWLPLTPTNQAYATAPLMAVVLANRV